LEEAEDLKKFADEHGFLISNTTGGMALTDAAIYALGMENMFSLVFRNPELINRLLDILLEWNLKYLRQILEAKTIDVLNYQGWCESYFPVKQYKTIIAPRVKKIIDMAHKFGVKVCYTPRDPPFSLYDMFRDIGIDIFWGCDPRSSAKYFSRIKQTVGDKICFWGGVNSQVTLGTGTKKQIEDETIDAIRTLGPGGGFILSAFDYLDGYTPWKNIEHMIRVWRKNRRYPIDI